MPVTTLFALKAVQTCSIRIATGVPLTHRGLSQAVTFVTATAGRGGAPDVDWGALRAAKDAQQEARH